MRRLALSSIAVCLAFASCDPGYESPCHVERRGEVVSEPIIGVRGNVSVARTDRGFVASWAKIEAPDAGADASLDDSTPGLEGFEVVDLDASGTLVRRELVGAPAELRRKRGSLEAIGVAREDGATLVHWTESATSTEPNGRLRTSFALKIAYGDRVTAPAAAACDRCAMRTTLVAFSDETLAIVRITPDVELDVLGKPAAPAFTGVRFKRDGTLESTPLPWLSPPAVPRVAGAQVVHQAQLHAERDLDGRFVITTDGRAWRVDRSFRLVAGPIDLPGADARALWGPDDSARPSVAWSVSPTDEGRATGQFTRREIFLASGTLRDRLSHGRLVFSAERRGDDVGVFFESSARGFFAVASADGKKRGGDVFVGAVEESGSQFGEYEAQDATAIASPSAGRFTIVQLGRGKLSSTEIACAP